MYKKLIEPFILGVIVSFYFFPVSFAFLPAAFNTKQMLALLGAIIFMLNSLRDKKFVFSKKIFYAACIALLFSVSCTFSVLYNGTSDKSYATYIVSFFVWLSGAYGMCSILKIRYTSIDIHLIIKYLMWVCVGQCIAALLNDNVPAFKAAVNTIFTGNQFLDDIGRMYGIGASLDPAGVRFSIVLLLIAYSLCDYVFEFCKSSTIWAYFFSFFFIVLVGNMISRTTTVGALLGLGYLFLRISHVEYGSIKRSTMRAICILLGFLIIAIPIVVYLYNTSKGLHSDIRFAFEGFFNWAETGEWRTDSTDKLNNVMWVWPTTFDGWIIGTGLFENFIYGTDIGYCRFTLYCGIVGLSIFTLFFMYNAIAVNRTFNRVGLLSMMLFALTLIIWIKVATDIFQIYAILFCIDSIDRISILDSTLESDDEY